MAKEKRVKSPLFLLGEIMLYYRCPHCGKRVARGEKCGCGFKREYGAPEGTRRLYHTAKWARLQHTMMARYSGLDAYAMSEHKRIEQADVVHHIVTAEEQPELFWTMDNLIPLSRHSHDEVHTAYREGGAAKEAVQAKLRALVRPLTVDEL